MRPATCLSRCAARSARLLIPTILILTAVAAGCSDTADSGGGESCDALLPEAPGATLFVSAACGDDGNDGLSAGTPVATLQAAASKAVSGDVIAVGEGSYGAASLQAGVSVVGAGAGKSIVSGGDGVALQIVGDGSATGGETTALTDLGVSGGKGAGIQGKGVSLSLQRVWVWKVESIGGTKGGHGVQLVDGQALSLEDCAIAVNEGAGVLANQVGSVVISDPDFAVAPRLDLLGTGAVDTAFEPAAIIDPAFMPNLIIDPAFSPASIIDPAFAPAAIIDPAFIPAETGSANAVPAGIIDPAFAPGSAMAGNGAGGVAIIDPAFAPGKPDLGDAAFELVGTNVVHNNGFGVLIKGDGPSTIMGSAITSTHEDGTDGGGDGLVVQGADVAVDGLSVVGYNHRAGVNVDTGSLDFDALAIFGGRAGVWGDVADLKIGANASVLGNQVVGLLIQGVGGSLTADGSRVGLTQKTGEGEGGQGVVIRKKSKTSLKKIKVKKTQAEGILVDDPALTDQGDPDVVIEDCEFEDVPVGVKIANVDDEKKGKLKGDIEGKNSFQTTGDAVDTENPANGPGELCTGEGCQNEAPPSANPGGADCADPNLDSDNDGTPDCEEIAQCPPGAEQTDAVAPGLPEKCDLLDNDCDGDVDEACGCPDGTWGPQCNPCACGANAFCNDGPQGDGSCTCVGGFAGPPECTDCAQGFTGDACDTCAPGFAGDDCDTCSEGFAGESCDTCAVGYFGEDCQPCDCPAAQGCIDGKDGDGSCGCPDGTYGFGCDPCLCGPNGTCDDGATGTGSCACAEGWTGPTCEQCAPGHFGPSCAPCACGDKGVCSEGLAGDGSCACDEGWAGPTCEACADGFFGASCEACACGEKQLCADGLGGDGACTCADGWVDVDGDAASGAAGTGCECAFIGEEACGNAIDDDCDGLTDEEGAIGCGNLFVDADQDGTGAGAPKCLCAAVDLYTAITDTDCDDANAEVNTDGTEACNGIDDDCDGLTDEGSTVDGEPDPTGCSVFFADADVDGAGDSADSKCLCAATDLYTAATDTDCDDTDNNVAPDGTEACNGIDDDCDGLTDEAGATGCATYYADADGDGAGEPADMACLCTATGVYTTADNNDCDDGVGSVYPGAPEACNGVDDDCDADTDEDFGDLGEACVVGTGACEADGFRVCGEDGLGTICQATEGGPQPEVCNGIDDDCDGTTDNEVDADSSCSDNNVCTGTETCGDDGSCQAGVALDCDDGVACTDDSCDPVVGCASVPNDGLCDDGNACTQDSCDLAAGCTFVDAPLDGAGCDDGDACTSADTCAAGVCTGDNVVCDDGNVCTDDSCDPNSGCVFTNNTAPCDDGDACTGSDTCASGACAGSTISCDDGNVCTDDSCDPATGCVLTANDSACDDGDACTLADACTQSTCVAGTAKDCDDGDSCTDDLCNPSDGQCLAIDKSVGAPCDDGASCTTGDNCLAFDGPMQCFGVPNQGACDDGDVCTTDICQGPGGDGDPITGCFNPQNEAPCNDGDACTTEDTCAEGTCVGGSPTICDDGNPCTDDSCDPAEGCQIGPNTGALCDDGDACTESDVCAAGSCEGADVQCDDANPCTDDSCDSASGCAFLPNEESCDDGDACTIEDSCEDTNCVGPPLDCDDEDVCTDDSCDPQVGCVYSNNTAACDDGDACTTGDACSAGICFGPGELACDDGNPCTDDVCDSASGCNTVNNTNACDDGNACTVIDTCAGGACVGGAPPVCDDGNPCTDDSCDPADGCQSSANEAPCDDGNACTLDDTCNAGGCAGVAVDCEDGNVCTNDSCDPASGCVGEPSGGPCDDGNACTISDACIAGGCEGIPQVCDDDNPCTDDSCDPASGECAFATNEASCDDGNACTINDECAEGTCGAGGTLNCDDGDPCTTDTCNPVTGCNNTPATGPGCDDGDACTTEDTCAAGGCAGSPVQCDDGDVCTNDSCDPATGCVFAPNTEPQVPCDDDNVCTTGDTCDGLGSCVSTPFDCDDENPCTDDSCMDAEGEPLCEYTNNTAACDDGDPCQTEDVCDQGSCTAGATLKDCDDSNECTFDACQAGTGNCLHTVGPVNGDACASGTGTCDAGTCHVCGDGTVSGPEGCDDGNADKLDGCGSSCQIEEGYTCSGAPSACQPICGDGLVLGDEECDDGNTTAGDLCSSSCKWEVPEGMVLIPKGDARLGCNATGSTGLCYSNEMPSYTADISAFAIQINEVTVAEYTDCVKFGGCVAPSATFETDPIYNYGGPGREDHPVNFVKHGEAQAYCKWMYNSGRLPTMGEWQKAARGGCELYDDCAVDTPIFPYGNEVGTCGVEAHWTGASSECEASATTTSAVGNYSPGNSPYGLTDMAGNVAEWLWDWGSSGNLDTNGTVDPLGPFEDTALSRAFTGGAFDDTEVRNLRSFRLRAWGTKGISSAGQGFRCVLPFEEICGDGVVRGDEECDDGNNTNGDGCTTSCVLETVAILEGDLVFTEAMPDPGQTGDFSGEWVEVLNTSNKTIKLTGLLFGDADSTSSITDPTAHLGPGEYGVLARNDDPASNGGIFGALLDWETPTLNQANDSIRLLSADGQTVLDHVAYTPSFGFSAGVAMQFDPLLLAEDLDGTYINNDSADGWCAAKRVYGDGDKGTPGKPNTPCGCEVDAECDDGVACTVDVCMQGACVSNTDNAKCDSSAACAPEFCAPNGCQASDPCDDGNDCTIDSCEDTGDGQPTCSYQPAPDGTICQGDLQGTCLSGSCYPSYGKP